MQCMKGTEYSATDFFGHFDGDQRTAEGQERPRDIWPRLWKFRVLAGDDSTVVHNTWRHRVKVVNTPGQSNCHGGGESHCRFLLPSPVYISNPVVSQWRAYLSLRQERQRHLSSSALASTTIKIAIIAANCRYTRWQTHLYSWEYMRHDTNLNIKQSTWKIIYT